ncbi:serine hydrolase [Paenalcaligenes niemegkensis]|nr:serine hydrolase [Paenalcaligenes niemegkensis]MCQ9617854.1 serine hydrolase [Paenalcaligenes niemegkensis]
MTTWLWARKPRSTTSRSIQVKVGQKLTVLFFVLCATPLPLAEAAENLIVDAARQAEVELDARVGLAIYDTGSGVRWLHNADERFPMVSTFKILACGALLAQSGAGYDRNRLVSVAQSDLVPYSPVTEKWVGQK